MMSSNVSKFLSLLLRHQPEKLNLQMDGEGWVYIDHLLDRLNSSGNPLTREELQYIVDTNNKKRFAISEDGLKIRASQGHTIDVDLKLKTQTPPPFLYHGTSQDFVSSILKSGLSPQSRNHVHLSVDIETALNVGSRKSKNVTILEIYAREMSFDGYNFYLSENNVWLADEVPSKYIKIKNLNNK
jgi:putative RNA 2'-phosphotransferase